MSGPRSTAPAGPATTDATPDPATIPVARSAWMPPRFFLLFGLAGVALHYALGGPVLLSLPWLGAAFAAAGFGVMAWGARAFSAAETTIKPFEKSRVVVTGGPYQFTRNPMYLGMVAMLAGLALAFGTLGPWAAVVALAVLLEVRFIRNEERALVASLGEPYERYRRSVRRWL